MNIPLNPEQRWEWIKYQLHLRDSSLAIIATELGLSRRQAINPTKRMPYPRAERAIAKTLDMEPWDIWPERWNEDGSPVRQRPNTAEIRISQLVKDKPNPLNAHRQCAEGA